MQSFVCITIYNANECVFSCKLSCISFLARKFCQFCRPSLVVGCACLMFAVGSRGSRRRCRSPSARRSAWNIGRWATPLPSPLRCSFLLVSAPRWWSPFFSVVLLLRMSCWGLWRSFLFRWGGYIRGYILSLFNRARNKRARTREGLLLFPASLPSAGLLTAFFSGGRCRGVPSTTGKRGGAFLFDFYICGGIVKNLHGHKISTAGAVLVPSWRCWFALLRLSVLGQAVTISAAVYSCALPSGAMLYRVPGLVVLLVVMVPCLLPAPCWARPWLVLYDLAIDAAGQALAYDARAVAP